MHEGEEERQEGGVAGDLEGKVLVNDAQLTQQRHACTLDLRGRGWMLCSRRTEAKVGEWSRGGRQEKSEAIWAYDVIH